MFQFEKGFAVARIAADQYAVIDGEGNPANKVRYNFATGLSGGFVKARQENGRYGWFTPDGCPIANGIQVDFGMDSLGVVLPFKQRGRIGWVDLHGTEILSPIYSRLTQPGKATDIAIGWQSQPGLYTLIKSDGQTLRELPGYDYISGSYMSGAVWARRPGVGWYSLNTDGEIRHENASPVPYDSNILQCNDVAATCTDPVKGKTTFIDNRGEYLFSRWFDSASLFSEGLAAVCIDGKFGYVNRNGETVIEPVFAAAYSFSGGFAPVEVTDSQSSSKITFIDQSGNRLIDRTFVDVEPFSNGVAVVTEDRNGAHSLLTSTGKILPIAA